jgi:hypothetical protein
VHVALRRREIRVSRVRGWHVPGRPSSAGANRTCGEGTHALIDPRDALSAVDGLDNAVAGWPIDPSDRGHDPIGDVERP